MAVTGKITGQNLYLFFNGQTLANGSAEEIVREFSWEYEQELVDSSAGGQSARTFVNSLKTGKGSLKMVFDGDMTLGAALQAGDRGTLTWGEGGTTSGYPKGSVVAIVQSVKRSAPYDDLVTQDIAFQFHGTLLSDPMSASWT
jgi:hypothetical protein